MTVAVSTSVPAKAPLLLSVDFEDWHQLVRRRLGVPAWEEAGAALPRQTAALLNLLDEAEVKATFFVLGMAARTHPKLVGEIAARGHEIGCHGDRHLPVFSQSPAEFASDLRSATETIQAVTGERPIGYRAPGFSITRDCAWAHRVLVEEGFAYDASQHDSPRIRGRMAPVSTTPYLLPLEGATLWEFPIAVWRLGKGRVPVGGASYWMLMPTSLILHGLNQAGEMAGLYLHPYEFDSKPLSVGLHAAAGASQRLRGAAVGMRRNLARLRAASVLRALATRGPLIPYGEAYARLSRDNAASS